MLPPPKPKAPRWKHTSPSLLQLHTDTLQIYIIPKKTHQLDKHLPYTLLASTWFRQFRLRQWNFHLLHNFKNGGVLQDGEHGPAAAWLIHDIERRIVWIIILWEAALFVVWMSGVGRGVGSGCCCFVVLRREKDGAWSRGLEATLRTEKKQRSFLHWWQRRYRRTLTSFQPTAVMVVGYKNKTLCCVHNNSLGVRSSRVLYVEVIIDCNAFVMV